MKNYYLAVVSLGMVVCLSITSCKGSKTAASSSTGGNPFGEVYEAPCTQLDTDEEFAATGISNGSKNRMDVLQTSALTNAQNIVRQKMQHAYKGAIDDYSSYIGSNAGSDAVAKVEQAGTQIIDRIVNDTKA
ncbi:MAG: hypothetical protein LBK45_04200, partial [Tannerellaceae bacterium]|nr:hypothetical protein [Tannerellaceae bacterium]